MSINTSDKNKFEYVHWLLSELLNEDKTLFEDEVNQAIYFLEELREKEYLTTL